MAHVKASFRARPILNLLMLKRSLVVALISTQITACGTLLYPERRGQTTGQIDVGVAALNAVGLLFFFVPGVVAFGVDFITGAIYLPSGGVAKLTQDELEVVRKNSNEIDIDKLKNVIAQRMDISLPKSAYTETWQASSMNSPHDLQIAMHLSKDQIALK
ncbi:hypothetical protein ABFY09_08615 [Marinomonas sp. 5E14-1]|uniref:hypothetical protein n=1 Tax=Marinomonas sp. 5E14-1 TaxID=3153922 RepID=UPI003265B154